MDFWESNIIYTPIYHLNIMIKNILIKIIIVFIFIHSFWLIIIVTYLSMTNFDNAAKSIKDSANHQPKVEMTKDELLQIYSLFKQGSVGDNNTDKPGMLDFTGKAKWEAWNKLKGKSKEQAQAEYVELARSLLTKYGIKPS